jgi:hypothetical protein
MCTLHPGRWLHYSYRISLRRKPKLSRPRRRKKKLKKSNNQLEIVNQEKDLLQHLAGKNIKLNHNQRESEPTSQTLLTSLKKKRRAQYLS